jgi:hypothetical protein
MVENAKMSKLLAIFNTLNDDDQDLVLEMSESLVKRREIDSAKSTAIAKKTTTDNQNQGGFIV